MLSAAAGEERYYEGIECYQERLRNPEKLGYRENWFPCIEMFQNAYREEPSGPYAAASLYMAGKLYRELYIRSSKGSDRASALDYFNRVIRRFPRSDYRPKAEEGIQSLSRKKIRKAGSEAKTRHLERKVRDKRFARSKAEYKASVATKIKDESHPEKKSPIFTKPSARKKSTSVITSLRFWSNPSYTRIVVDADGETPFSHKLLKKDPSANKPHRLYIDFEDSRLGKNIKRLISINDDLLTNARAGQQMSDLVRVVIDIKSFKTYKIFSLRNPFRTVIDVWGGDASNRPGSKIVAKRSSKKKKKKAGVIKRKPGKKKKREGPIENKKPRLDKSENLAISLALGVKRIVIDPGHGGRDGGAVGYNKRVYEKNVVLSIAKRLARKIRRKLGCEVIMTRTTDRFLSLEERTAIANTKNADLFISIHTNSHEDKRAYGIETYFLNLATDEDAVRVAARENATTRRNISDLEKILNDLMHNAKINESSRLAAYVQKSLCGHLKRRYSKINNKGVKQAPFYVLLGAHMPSVLIETSFISNKRECKRLTDSTYQDHLCEAILRGIRKYIQETNPTALLRMRPKRSG
ncbi:N-acetylmuramoyl-L-alanine amidase [Desulfobacterales bacterium HSG2]|nr:N-acetylmuramoyl-L-alanine amidase [Desulfobacterales bacterium HSG2]